MDSRSIGDEYKTGTSPNYAVGSRNFTISVTTALALVLANILGMWYLAQTEVADFMVWTYTGAFGAPFTGLAIFGVVLTAGRYFGLKSIANDNMAFAWAMILLVEVTYAVFGAGVLSMYSSNLWGQALGATFVFVALYTLIVTGVVYSTDHSFENWGGYSAVFMIGGVFAVLIYSMASWGPLMLLGFAAITIGFMIDLVYEIWHTSSRGRGALANGFAVYIAFMGVFVHVLQLVLEMMAADG